MEEDRPVDQRVIHLLEGHAGLHELGFMGQNVLVGLVDTNVYAPDLEPWIAKRTSPLDAERGAGESSHGDKMANVIVRAAPGVRLVVADAFDTRGNVYRKALAHGVNAVLTHDGVRLVNVSLEILRVSNQCRDDAPCVACESVNKAASLGNIVVAAAGNQGSSVVTCPGAASGALTVAASVGPPGEAPPSWTDGGPVMLGTSIAAAFVTGGCAALMSAFPDLTLEEFRNALSAAAPKLVRDPSGRDIPQPHYFRAYRYLEHVRNNHKADVSAAEALAAKAATELEKRPINELEEIHRARVIDLLVDAVHQAPWAPLLHLWLGILREASDPTRALLSVTEAIRLEWSIPDAHDVCARLLDRFGDRKGGDIERRIADLLRRSELLKAADELLIGLSSRDSGTQVDPVTLDHPRD